MKQTSFKPFNPESFGIKVQSEQNASEIINFLVNNGFPLFNRFEGNAPAGSVYYFCKVDRTHRLAANCTYDKSISIPAGMKLYTLEQFKIALKNFRNPEIEKKTVRVTLEVNFIEEAYKAACPQWKKKLEKKFPFLKEENKVVARVGSIVDIAGSQYIISRVHNVSSAVVLVNVETGNIWSSDLVYPSDMVITREEMREIADGREFKVVRK